MPVPSACSLLPATFEKGQWTSWLRETVLALRASPEAIRLAVVFGQCSTCSIFAAHQKFVVLLGQVLIKTITRHYGKLFN